MTDKIFNIMMVVLVIMITVVFKELNDKLSEPTDLPSTEVEQLKNKTSGN